VVEADIPVDRDPGRLITGVQRSRHRDPETIARERRQEAEFRARQRGDPIGGRYGVNPRR
jgi:hypothetical protein